MNRPAFVHHWLLIAALLVAPARIDAAVGFQLKAKPRTNDISSGAVSNYLVLEMPALGTNSTQLISIADLVTNTLATLNPGGGSGEANVLADAGTTNSARISQINGKSGVSLLVKTDQAGYGLVKTNQATNIVTAIDPAVVATQGDLTAASNTLRSTTQPASLNLTNISATGALSNRHSVDVIFQAALEVGSNPRTNNQSVVRNHDMILNGAQFSWHGRGANTNAPSVIIDIDYGGDSDDAVDLALAARLHKMGLIKIVAVTHSASNDWGAASVSAALGAYGIDVPVGLGKTSTGGPPDVYGSYVATNFFNPARVWATNVLPAVQLLRHVLAQQPDSNVIVIATGTLKNIQDLTTSTADAISSHDGYSLLIRKLRPDFGLVVVAGIYTNSSGLPNGPEANIASDVGALTWANNYNQSRPFPVTWFGIEVFDNVLTGGGWWTNMSRTDPAYHALRLQGVSSRNAWAQGAVLMAALGTNYNSGSAGGTNLFSFVHGTNQIVAGGSNIWWNGSYVGQKYVVRLASTNFFRTLIDSLVMPDALNSRTFVSRVGGEVLNGGKYTFTNGAQIYVGPDAGVSSDVYIQNSARGSGSLVIGDASGTRPNHFHFGANEDIYLRGGSAGNGGRIFIQQLSSDSSTVIGNGANTTILHSASTILSNQTPTSIIGIDGNNKLKAVALSGLTFDGTTLTATGGGSGSTNPVVLARGWGYDTNAVSVGVTNLGTNATVTFDLMGPPVGNYGIFGNSTINLTNLVTFTNHPGGRKVFLKVRQSGVSGTLTVTPIGPHPIDWQGNLFLAANATNTLVIEWDGTQLTGSRSHAETTGSGAYSLSNAPSIYAPKFVNATASRALMTDAQGQATNSAVTSTELGYLSGATSALQTQLNGKQNGQTNANQFGASTTLTIKKSALATNLVNLFEPVVVSGTGGANTNFTLQAIEPEVSINGFTNVSIRAVMQTDPTFAAYLNVTITNLSGSDRTLEFSAVTNRWRFAGVYGTNAPSVLTNNTALLMSLRCLGTNTLVGYSYFAAP